MRWAVEIIQTPLQRSVQPYDGDHLNRYAGECPTFRVQEAGAKQPISQIGGCPSGPLYASVCVHSCTISIFEYYHFSSQINDDIMLQVTFYSSLLDFSLLQLR